MKFLRHAVLCIFRNVWRDNFFNTLTGIFQLKVNNRRAKIRRTRLGEQSIFCGDMLSWICWKPRSPRKLIHTKMNLTKVYLLKIKKIHNIETASCRSLLQKCRFAKSYYMQHFWSSNESVLHSAIVLINL